MGDSAFDCVLLKGGADTPRERVGGRCVRGRIGGWRDRRGSGRVGCWVIGRPSQGGFSIGWIAGSMAELEGYILYWQLCIGSKNHSNNENNFHPHLIHILLH